MKSLLKRVLPPAAVQGLRNAVDASTRPFKLRRAAAVGSRLANYRPDRKTVLFFAPEGGVRLYLIVQAVIGKALQEAGYNAVFVRCHLAFPRCPVKDSVLLPYDASPAQHAAVCLHCHDQTLAVLNAYDLDYLDIRELLPPEAHQRVAQQMAALPADRVTFVHEGIQVGRLAFYDFAIVNKHSAEMAMGPREVFRLDRYIENCLLAIEAVKAARRRISIDTIACFDEYCMMSCARLAAQAQGVEVSRMMSVAYHFNGDPRRIVAMASPTIIVEQAYRAAQWGAWRELPLAPTTINEIVDDLIFRLTGSGAHIYSPNKTDDAQGLLQRLRLSPDRKLLVAFPSSRDELDALKFNLDGLCVTDVPPSRAFADQFEWLDALVDWVEASSEYQLVVRIHPRVGVTPRDGIRSPDYDRYRSKYGGNYDNCRIVWPEERISSYDLVELADCALVSWSSMGLELARFGLPVLSGLTSILTIAPPGADFIRLAGDKDTYFANLQRLCGSFDADQTHALRNAYRWYNMFYLGNSIDVSDVLSSAENLPPYQTPVNASVIERVMIQGGEAMVTNLASLRGMQDAASEQREAKALQGQLGRMIHYFATGVDTGRSRDLHVSVDPIAFDVVGAVEGALQVVGRDIIYGHEGVVVRRYSPLAARLGRLYDALNLQLRV